MVQSNTVYVEVTAPVVSSISIMVDTSTVGITVDPGQSFTIKGTVYDQWGNPMPGVKLKGWRMYEGGTWEYVKDLTSDANGNFTWTETLTTSGRWYYTVTDEAQTPSAGVPE